MCLPLVGHVLAVDGDYAEVALEDGEQVRVNRVIHPDAAPGQHVLIDRGLIIEVLAPEQLAEVRELYAVLAQSWDAEEMAGD